MIEPHGGILVNRENFKSAQELSLLHDHYRLPISRRTLNDLEMIASGVFSPVESFLVNEDFNSVIEKGRLKNGLPWTIPIVLAVDEKQKEDLRKEEKAYLEFDGEIYGEILIDDIFEADKLRWVEGVYQTDDISHPGVAYVKSLPPFLLGGKIEQFKPITQKKFLNHRFTPTESRKLFEKNQWDVVTAFQTRNPIHRAHEYLLRCSLEMSDALFIHPLVGETKSDDVPPDVRMECYNTLIDNYFPKNRVLLGAFPAAMNYAGPKEAIFHAICRKNYGCSHFIVGRDHAGVGNFYGTYDAHDIFDEYSEQEIGIIPLKFEHAFYCHYCKGMASEKTCPKPDKKENHVFLSGTKLREMLSKGDIPPQEFTRSEVAKILIESYQ